MMLALVRGLSGTVHVSTCRLYRELHKVIAPEIPVEDVADFLEARDLTKFVCGACLRDWRTR